MNSFIESFEILSILRSLPKNFIKNDFLVAEFSPKFDRNPKNPKNPAKF
jgi:hypothetical protein